MLATVARTPDPAVTSAALEAALELLAERGYARVTMEAIAERAGIGKPALYRRYADKAELVAAAIAGAIPPMEPADPGGDVRSVLRRLIEQAAPADPPRYAALVGGLMAEQPERPELIAAYRRSVLGPRRAVVRAVIERGQLEGRIEAWLDPELLVDMIGGAFLARTFAGLPVDAAWRSHFFAQWWALVARSGPADRAGG